MNYKELKEDGIQLQHVRWSRGQLGLALYMSIKGLIEVADADFRGNSNPDRHVAEKVLDDLAYMYTTVENADTLEDRRIEVGLR